MANSVESLATDIYSEDKRFIYELIQNADDAALDENSELAIQILKNYVIILHNGAPFNSRDIRGLCSIGLGTKTNDASKTGYKGIGFKSVFGQPDGLVYVKSEHTLFKFDREYSLEKGWNTKWGNKSEWEERNGVTFNCPWQMMPVLIDDVDDAELTTVLNNENYTVKTAIKIVDSQQIYDNINRFFGDAKFLLFLRRITRVVIKYNNHNITFKKVKKQDKKEIVTLVKNDELQSNWYVKNWIHNIPLDIQKELKADQKTPKKIQSMEKTEISFALEINNKFDEIKLLEEGRSTLYSYLPTTENGYNIPFIVNCNFLLDASREKIHKNRKWNEWLFQVIGYKMVECCSEFLTNDLFESTYLTIFRNGFYQESDNLRIKFNIGLEKGLEKFAVLKNRENKPSKLREIALDGFNLFQVEPKLAEKIAQYISETQENVSLDAKNIIELCDTNKPILKLKPFLIKEEHLQSFFATDAISEVITITSNYNILSFLSKLEINDIGGSWYTVITKNHLIINHYGELDFIQRVCFPIDLEENYETEFKNVLINNEVFQAIKNDTELKEWLVKLGVTKPGSIAYLEKEIIGNIQNIITGANYLNITRFIYQLHIENSLTEKHYVNLQELPLKTNKGFVKANKCLLSKSYKPTINLYDKLREEAYLLDDYLQIANTNECRTFFKTIGVQDDIEFIRKMKINSPDLPMAFVEESNKYAKIGHAYPHLIGVFYPNTPISNVPYYLQTFTFLEQTNKLDFAKTFWNRIFDKYTLIKDRESITAHNYAPQRDYVVYNLGMSNELFTIDEMAWGRQLNNTAYIPSYLLWYILNSKCIPTNLGMKLANESYVNEESICELVGDFLPVISIDKIIPEDWNQVLKLKTTLTIDDLCKILNCLSDLVNRKGYLDKENEKRLGLIYNELLHNLNKDYDNTSNKIRNWAINGRLVSSGKKNLKASNLIHIKITGFENINVGVDTIFLPKNVETNDPNFIKLLSLFGVKIIDEFSYQSETIREKYDLKIKLLRIIGPICLLLKNKLIVSDLNKAMYDRFIKISKTKFILCKNIRPIFTNQNEVIIGDVVNFCHDKVEKNFLISKEWSDPLTLLEISFEISSLLTAVRLEKEIMMLLNLPLPNIEQYLISQKLDPKEYQSTEIYSEITTEINKLEELISIKQTIQNVSISLNASPKIIENNENLNKEDDIRNDESDYNTQKELDSDEVSAKTIKDIDPDLTEEDEAYIKGVINFTYNSEGQMDANTTAKIKTLIAIKSQYNDAVITDEGRFLKAGDDEILVRSAQKGLLYLDLYSWDRLNHDNVKISIFTKNQISILNSQDSLFKFCKPLNKFGVLRMPEEFSLDDYNSFNNITEKSKWHYVFIVNEKSKAVQNYNQVINLDDYNY